MFEDGDKKNMITSDKEKEQEDGKSSELNEKLNNNICKICMISYIHPPTKFFVHPKFA
jgi:hypothetical protein